MGFTIEEIDVKAEGKIVGSAAVHVFSGDQAGVKDAIDFFGGGETGMSKLMNLANSAHRVAEQGKVRSGTDPAKAARNAIQKLTPEARQALIDELKA